MNKLKQKIKRNKLLSNNEKLKILNKIINTINFYQKVKIINFKMKVKNTEIKMNFIINKNIKL